jgi:uncharacterized protein involved in tolerance to divalent cations
LKKRLLALYTYKTPEFIALDPVEVSGDYADWVRASC